MLRQASPAYARRSCQTLGPMSIIQRLLGKSTKVPLSASGSHPEMLEVTSRSLEEEFGRASKVASRLPMISLVALSRSWVQYSVEEMLECLDSIFPGQFTPAQRDRNWVTQESSDQLAIQCLVDGYAGFYYVNGVPGPYAAFSNFLFEVHDSGLRKLCSEQPFWFSVDVLRKHGTDEDAYRFAGLLLSALAHEDSAVLVQPFQGSCQRLTPKLRRQLAAGGSSYGTA